MYLAASLFHYGGFWSCASALSTKTADTESKYSMQRYGIVESTVSIAIVKTAGNF